MRRASKTDSTHGPIRDALRKAGVRVHDTSAVGNGYPDLHCSYRGYSALVECKTGKSGLRESQREFKRDWEGPLIVSNDPERAVEEFFKSYAVSILKRI